MRSLQTNHHEKAQQEREQKVDILQYELQKEMDTKLQQEERRLKHEDEMKFNASKRENGE
jgi:exonuclease VII large subunit